MKTQFGHLITKGIHWYLSVMLLLLAGSSLAVDSGRSFATRNAAQTSPKVPQGISTLDLRPHCDLLADESSQFGMWEVVPKGAQELNGVPYQIDGMIRLFGQVPPPHGTVYRDQVEGIKVGKAFQGLYLLHGTGWTTEDGVEIAKVVFNYADGSSCEAPLIYGEHVRDWWKREARSPDAVTDPNSRIVWEGSRGGIGLRFYQTVLFNPSPDKEVASIDLVSLRSVVTPAIIAMSVGPAQRSDARLEKVVRREPAGETAEFKISVVDSETNDPLPQTALQVTFCDENSCRYLGAYQTDQNGEKLLVFPTKTLRSFNISILREGYGADEVSWSEQPGTAMPAGVKVKLDKGKKSEGTAALRPQIVLASFPTARPQSNSLKVGDMAPDFEVETLSGKPLKLADYRGKYVLLDFWAVWCGPCVAEMPHLKEVYEAFGSDKRFEMVGLSLDPKAETTQKFVDKNDIKWTQGFLGDWSKTKVPREYGVSGIPSLFLIGPDGRVVAKDMRGRRIKTVVGEALGK